VARRGLGSSKAEHTAAASKAAAQIEYTAATTVNKARNGQCTAALMGYAEMQRAIGEFEAHTRSGGKAWKPATAIHEAAYEFSTRCVRESGLDGARKRRR